MPRRSIEIPPELESLSILGEDGGVDENLEPELSDIAEARYRSSISILKVLLRRGHAGGRLDWSAMRLGNIKDLIYLLTPKEILPHPVYRALFLLKRRLSGGLRRLGTLGGRHGHPGAPALV